MKNDLGVKNVKNIEIFFESKKHKAKKYKFYRQSKCEGALKSSMKVKSDLNLNI